MLQARISQGISVASRRPVLVASSARSLTRVQTRFVSGPAPGVSRSVRRVATTFLPVTLAAGSVFYLLQSSRKSSSLSAKMSDKLCPPHPDQVMVIRDITRNVVTLSVPFARFGLLPVGGRATIVKLTSGSLAVFSPVSLTPAVKSKIAEMGGNVKYIIAPDTEHHIFITEWATAYPEAKIIGPEGLPEKRLTQTSNPRVGAHPKEFYKVFTAKNKLNMTIDPEFDADFLYEMVEVHPNKELAFLYKPDKVMIEADLLWNLPPTEQYSRVPAAEVKTGILGKIFAALQGTQGEAKGQRRFLWWAISRADREGFNASARRMDAWDFDTVIPCHGDVMVGNGKEIYRKVYAWHLPGGKQK